MSKSFQGERKTFRRVITIDSTPDKIFPLLCPVRENEWAPGWNGKAIFAKSGLAELNGVFASEHQGEADTIWFVTRRDETAHVIEFVYFVPGEQVVRLGVGLTAVAPEKSTLAVEYLRTGISEAGNEVIRNDQPRFDAMMNEWEASMNHFLKTGQMIQESH